MQICSVEASMQEIRAKHQELKEENDKMESDIFDLGTACKEAMLEYLALPQVRKTLNWTNT